MLAAVKALLKKPARDNAEARWCDFYAEDDSSTAAPSTGTSFAGSTSLSSPGTSFSGIGLYENIEGLCGLRGEADDDSEACPGHGDFNATFPPGSRGGTERGDELEDPGIVLQSLAGSVLASVRPVPETVWHLKLCIESQLGIPPALQQLVQGIRVLGDDEQLEARPMQLTLLHNELPLYAWDRYHNPGSNGFTAVDGHVHFTGAVGVDFVNVLTEEPLRRGAYYFEFVMHRIGDEQWCGVVADRSQAGCHARGRDLSGCLYYCGRRWEAQRRRFGGRVSQGRAGLQVDGCIVGEVEKARDGDVIGMLVDMGLQAAAFSLNGRLQGACRAPPGPLYVSTRPSKPGDHVELRKVPAAEAPLEMRLALEGPLLETSCLSSDSDASSCSG